MGEMIALDSHPFSVEEDVGFLHFMHHIESCYSALSRKCFVEIVFPRITVGVMNDC